MICITNRVQNGAAPWLFYSFVNKTPSVALAKQIRNERIDKTYSQFAIEKAKDFTDCARIGNLMSKTYKNSDVSAKTEFRIASSAQPSGMTKS